MIIFLTGHIQLSLVWLEGQICGDNMSWKTKNTWVKISLICHPSCNGIRRKEKTWIHHNCTQFRFRLSWLSSTQLQFHTRRVVSNERFVGKNAIGKSREQFHWIINWNCKSFNWGSWVLVWSLELSISLFKFDLNTYRVFIIRDEYWFFVTENLELDFYHSNNSPSFSHSIFKTSKKSNKYCNLKI